jgi:hypothetical protein
MGATANSTRRHARTAPGLTPLLTPHSHTHLDVAQQLRHDHVHLLIAQRRVALCQQRRQAVRQQVVHGVGRGRAGGCRSRRGVAGGAAPAAAAAAAATRSRERLEEQHGPVDELCWYWWCWWCWWCVRVRTACVAWCV